MTRLLSFLFFFFHHPATTEIYTLSLHDALPIYLRLNGSSGELVRAEVDDFLARAGAREEIVHRSEEHTSELQSLRHLVCRLLLEKKKKKKKKEHVNKNYIHETEMQKYSTANTSC